jgi:hypothetical protein
VNRNNVADLVKVEQRDLFTVDLSTASVVTLYLTPGYHVRLIPQLRKLKNGSRVVTHQFEIRGLKPTKVVQVQSTQDRRQHEIYLYTAPF